MQNSYGKSNNEKYLQSKFYEIDGYYSRKRGKDFANK